MQKIVFVGGGTGGHIYPGLAIADELKKSDKNIQIFWIGNIVGMDRTIVEKSVGVDGICSVDKFFGIPSGKFRRYFTIQNFIDLFKIFAGFVASFFILLKVKPKILFSKGGFVSVPPCLCARILGIPVFTHECDFTPGLATKINSKSATSILLSYEETKKFFSKNLQKKLVVTGNPIRPVFWNTNKDAGFSFLQIDKNNIKKPILLVLGGSSGSRQINDLVLENLDFLVKNFIVVHQTGMYQNETLKKNVTEEFMDDYKSYNFIYEQMSDVISCADIVLSRAGANSLWECVALEKPMVLIPLCGQATRGDQVDNAIYFEKQGIAISLVGKNVDSEHLKNALISMLDVSKRLQASMACKNFLSKEKPSEKIASLLLKSL